MRKELIDKFWKSLPEIPRDEVYTTPAILLIQLTPNLNDCLWQSDVNTVAESVKTNKDLGPINDIVLENQ